VNRWRYLLKDHCLQKGEDYRGYFTELNSWKNVPFIIKNAIPWPITSRESKLIQRHNKLVIFIYVAFLAMFIIAASIFIMD
jgi:hypothetical protein